MGIVVGNWKLNKGCAETQSFLRSLKKSLGTVDAIVGVAPPFTSLTAAAEIVAGSPIKLVSQNVSWADSGAFTGEVSAPMLKEVGCQMALVGHSERRQYFGETNETVNKRIQHAVKHGLQPIFCLGESLEEREQGKTFDVTAEQIRVGLSGLTANDMSSVIIAYEPVWAIGTGKTATPDQAQEVHSHLRTLLREQFGPEVSQGVKLIYGGSVKPSNAAELASQEDIDGALVGGASLEPDSFLEIIRGCSGA